MRGINLNIRQEFADEFCFTLSLESPAADILCEAEKFIAANPDCPFQPEQLAAIGENARDEWHNAGEPLPADDSGETYRDFDNG